MRPLYFAALITLTCACTHDRHHDESYEPTTVHSDDTSRTHDGVRAQDESVDKKQWDSSSQTAQASAPTAQEQSNDAADVKLLQSVRQTLVNDDSLSFNAKNVKVIVRNGDVTLRGVVKDSGEHDRVVTLTRACSGVRSVIDQIETES